MRHGTEGITAAMEPTFLVRMAERAPTAGRTVRPQAITAGHPMAPITLALPTTPLGEAGLRIPRTHPTAPHIRAAAATTQPLEAPITMGPALMLWEALLITAPRVPVSVMREAQLPAAEPGEEAAAAAGHLGRIAAAVGQVCVRADLGVDVLVEVVLAAGDSADSADSAHLAE